MKKKKNTKRSTQALFVHKKHTGRKLAKKHTSYAILVFIILCLGVVIYNATLQVRAAEVAVTGRVPGDPPTEPAVITHPVADTKFTNIPIPVNGTCPPLTIVRLYRNDFFAGSALCGIDNTFSLNIDLFHGANELKARIYNYGETEGPVSETVQVNYQAATPSAAPSAPVVPSDSGPYAGLLLKTETAYKGIKINDTVHWKLEISGGSPPYAISVDWGDGQTSVLSRDAPGIFEITHTYEKTGGYNGGYPIVIKSSDINGLQTYLQLVIIVTNPAAKASVVPGASTTRLPFSSAMRNAWSLYGMVLLMTVSFWLGERRGFSMFGNKGNNKRLRSHQL